MRKKHKEYLIIPIANIKTKDNIDERISLISNSENVIKNHQKIVLKLRMKNNIIEAYELITGELFYFKDSLFNILYRGNLCDSINIESEELLINIHPKFVTIDEVKTLFDEIIDAGEATKYQELISKVLLKREKRLIKKKEYDYL